MANFFRRVEKKYIITKQQFENLKKIIKTKMIEDEHGESNICNIYFDTENYDLIRNSIAKPIFKDKVRLRSYNTPKIDDEVYLEIKRKYDGVVSKRRIELKLSEFYKCINKNDLGSIKTQIAKELNYYYQYYNLKPTMFLSYDRIAYYDEKNKDFRLTFDNNITARNYDLQLENGIYGEKILDKNYYIMEIKTLGAMPMWLVNALNQMKIYPSNFSKYGEAYEKLIVQENLQNKFAV